MRGNIAEAEQKSCGEGQQSRRGAATRDSRAETEQMNCHDGQEQSKDARKDVPGGLIDQQQVVTGVTGNAKKEKAQGDKRVARLESQV